MELIVRGSEVEVWKDIVGWEGLYQVSNYGNVKSLHFKKEKLLKPATDSKGYKQIGLYNKNKTARVTVHRLVAEHFIPNPENKPEVNHKDLNKSNNHDWNLEWFTRSENIIHSVKNGHHYVPVGIEQPNAKINDNIARLIKLELKDGKMPLEVSKNLNVSYNTVKDIKRGRVWTHVEV